MSEDTIMASANYGKNFLNLGIKSKIEDLMKTSAKAWLEYSPYQGTRDVKNIIGPVLENTICIYNNDENSGDLKAAVFVSVCITDDHPIDYQVMNVLFKQGLGKVATLKKILEEFQKQTSSYPPTRYGKLGALKFPEDYGVLDNTYIWSMSSQTDEDDNPDFSFGLGSAYLRFAKFDYDASKSESANETVAGKIIQKFGSDPTETH